MARENGRYVRPWFFSNHPSAYAEDHGRIRRGYAGFPYPDPKRRRRPHLMRRIHRRVRRPRRPYVLKYFDSQQARTVEALSEVIIPADDHSPARPRRKCMNTSTKSFSLRRTT